MKKKIIIIGIVILLLLGVSYAWINYYQEGTNKKVLGSNLYLYLNETSNNVLLQNVYPLSVSEAREETDNTISFSVEGKNTSSEDIFYEIKLAYGTEDDNLVRLNDKDLRFDLVEITEENNEEVETYLLEAASFSTINNRRIWVGTVDGNTSSEIVKNYKLRVWLSDDILISDTDPNRDYCATDNCVQGERAFKDHYASVKVAVYGDMVEKDLNSLYYAIKTDTNTTKFTSAHQDSIDNHGHQDIYYYTDDTNSNVLFNDTCWQIVRTTDTGGVKLLYNGEVENAKIFASSTTLTNSQDDIDIVSNTASYAFTYSDGWWTSGAVPNSGTGTIEFKVKEAGYYTIDYDLSTEVGGDYIYVYLDNVLIRQDSGILTDSIRLGDLTTNSVVKVTYKKNSSKKAGDDQIRFSTIKGTGDSYFIDTCDTKRSSGIGLVGAQTTSNLGGGTYKYGTTYTYTSSGFTLGGTITSVLWSDSTYESVLGKYTCANTSTSCTKLYYVQTYNSNTQAGVTSYTVGENRKYDEIGRGPFNEHYTSLSSIGYMYNNMYEYKTKNLIDTMLSTYTLKTSHKYSNSVNWNTSNNRYDLVSSATISSYANALNKYTAGNTSSYGASVRYIVAVSSSTGYYINLTNEGTHDLAYFNRAYVYGDSYVEENGQYRINNSQSFNRTDWYTIYSSVKNKYVCPGSSSLCNKEDLRYVTNTSTTTMTYFNIDVSYRFGHDVTYSNGTYTLTGTTQDVANYPITYAGNNAILKNTHYTCFNETGSNECGSEVYFVYWTDSGNIRYIELKDGKTKDDALYEMINYKGGNASKPDADINKYDSAIKQMIDHWYEHTSLTNKTNKLEDTIFCNDRTIYSNNLRSWDLSKTTHGTYTLYFVYTGGTGSSALTCTNVNDQFSTKNSKAKLTYPVGLLTEQERGLMMNTTGGSYISSGLAWWTSSPYALHGAYAYNRYVNSSGGTSSTYVYSALGVRPVLSISSDAIITGGTGTYDDPYVIE